jgi:membrane-associated protein
MNDVSLIAVGGILALCESMLGVGVILPGELIITSTSTLVSRGNLPLLVIAVLVGASAGDQLNYWFGRRLGPRLVSSRLGRRIGAQRWDRATELMARRGALAVLMSRLLPVVRTLMPGVAGIARMPFATFTVASVAGSAVWAVAWVCVGPTASVLLGRPDLLVLAAAAGLVLVVLGRRLRRRLVSS